MTRYIPLLIIAGILLFLVGMPITAVVGTLILVNLVVLIEDHITGGRIFRKIVKEIKREPIVIHDVIIESDGKEDIKWKKNESNSSSRCWSNGTKSIGRDIHQ